MSSFKGFVKSIWKKSNEDFLFTHAAALTYYSFIYFVPVLALFYFFFDYFDGFEQIKKSIQSLMGAYLAPQLAETILGYVKTIQEQVNAETVGVFGVIGFIVSSCLMLYQIEFSFNSMLGKTQPQHRIRRMFRYALLMTLGPIFIGLSILTQQSVFKINEQHFDVTLLAVMVSILPFVTTIIFMTVLYKWVSAIKLRWTTALKAALFAGVGIEILKQLYAYYVVYSLKGSAYGAMAVLPLFLVWINTIWTITLFGGQICSYIHAKNNPDFKNSPDNKVKKT